MRRLPLALTVMIALAAATPSRAQAFGGWGPCDGPCRPWAGPGWAGGAPPYARWRFGLAQGFAPGSWWSPRAVRWRRFAARQAGFEPRAEAGVPPRFGGWVWRRPAPTFEARRAGPAAPTVDAARPAARQADEAVAAMPTEATRRLPRAPARVPSRVLAAAAMLRREAVPALPVPRPALPPRRAPEEADTAPAPRPSRAVSRPRRPAVQPAALRNEPAQVEPAAAGTHSSEVQPQSPSSPAAPAVDVPAAPLD